MAETEESKLEYANLKGTDDELKRQRTGSMPTDILTLNDEERGITPEDSDDVKWNYIEGARCHHLILSGVVSGLEKQLTPDPVVAVDYKGIRIAIPGRQMFVDSWPEDEVAPRKFLIRLGRILGATVDFMLFGVDIRDRAAVASRKAALLQRQSMFYDTGRVKPNVRVAARVIGVGGDGIMIEALGVDTVIPINELSWKWFADVNELYSTGDLVVARILDVAQDTEDGTYSVKASIKQATSNPDSHALRRLNIDSTYFGTVTGVHDRLIFVRLRCGVNAKTKLYYSKEIPAKYDTVCFRVRGLSEEFGVAYGTITRIVKRHKCER